MKAYNDMLSLPVTIQNMEDWKNKPIQKFSDNATGIARCEALASRIRAWSAGPDGTEGVQRVKKAKEPKAPKEKKAKVEKAPRTTIKSKVFAELEKQKGNFIDASDLIYVAYGKDDDKLRGALANVLRGITKDIKGATFTLESEKGKRFGFFDKIKT